MTAWREVFLEEVADEITVGFVGPMVDEYRNSGIPFFRSLNIKPLRIETEDLKFISPEFHNRIHKSQLKPGDVVIVRTGDPGTATVIPDSFTDANCADLVVVRPSKELNPYFLAYYVNAVAHHQVAAHVVGAVQQHFNVGSAKQLANERESLTLAALRDALLPKLLSGEIRVTDAGKIVEAQA